MAIPIQVMGIMAMHQAPGAMEILLQNPILLFMMLKLMMILWKEAEVHSISVAEVRTGPLAPDLVAQLAISVNTASHFEKKTLSAQVVQMAHITLHASVKKALS